MSSAHACESTSWDQRSARSGRRATTGWGWARRIEYEARALPKPAVSREASYVGRIGALAFALGVGAAIASMPAVAFADKGGSDGSAGSSSQPGAASSPLGQGPPSGAAASPSAGSSADSTSATASSESGDSSSGSGSDVSSDIPTDISTDTDTDTDIPTDVTPDASGSDSAAGVSAGSVPGLGLGDSDSSWSASMSEPSGVFGGGTPSGAVVPAAVPDADEVAVAVSALIEVPAVGDGPSAVSGAGVTDVMAPMVAGAALVMTAAPVEVSPGTATGLVGQTSGDGPEAPVTEPFGWGALAVVRGEAGNGEDASGAAGQPGAAQSGEPFVSGGAKADEASAVRAAAVGSAVSALGDSIWLFGNGTAEHPDGGLIWGNGFTWDADSCTGAMACDGGNSGTWGDGGSGFNGGNGGSAGWFGNGGDGGAGAPGGDGGNGGTGGLVFGNGGNGGAGGAAVGPGGIGGRGGNGGGTGLLSWAGETGAGGPGTDGGAAGNGGYAGSSLITIYKGTNFSLPRQTQFLVEQVSGRATFTTNSIYDLKDEDQYDWNKLTGITFTPLRPDTDAIMVAWRYNVVTQMFEIGPYYNVDLARIMPTQSEVIAVPLGQEFLHSLDYNGITLTYGDQTVHKPIPANLSPKVLTAVRINSWFGGTSVAPKTISYYLENQ